jgi:hypothetical protein
VSAHHQPSPRARIAAWWASFHTDPYTEEELALLRQAPVEGKAIRRHRRKRRAELLRNGGGS